jgi:plasmid maintenance system killer protein
MGTSWISEHWFDLFQTIGIAGSFFFTAVTLQKDGLARRVGNSIAMNGQYQIIQRELIRNPQLKRVFDAKADIESNPISIEEEAFVKMTIAQLSTAYRAMKHGEFVELEELEQDVRGFFGLPIPKAVWEKFSSVQNNDFIDFVDSSQHSS